MPLYQYECLECGLCFDRLQRLGQPEHVSCPNGNPQVLRLLSQPAIIFKGSGFYVTDNRRASVQKPVNGDQRRNEKESTSE